MANSNVVIPKDVPTLNKSELTNLRKVRDLKTRALRETKEAFRETVVPQSDGSWVARPRGKRQMQQLREIQSPYMRALSERSLNRQSGAKRVQMKGPDGAVHWVEPARAETFAKMRGLVPVKRHRGRPAHLVPYAEFRTPWPWEVA